MGLIGFRVKVKGVCLATSEACSIPESFSESARSPECPNRELPVEWTE